MIEKNTSWPEKGKIPNIDDFTEKNGILSCGPYILKPSDHGWSAIICKANFNRYEKEVVSENNNTAGKALWALQQYLESEPKETQEDTKTQALIDEYLEYGKTHTIQSARTGFITCNTCRSLLNKKLLPSNRCPLCGNDLRPKAVIDKLQQLRDRIKSSRTTA